MLARALCAPNPSDSVRTVKIYTKTGDGGETGLFGGPRVKKSDPRVEAYGDVDELNAAVGAARALVEDPEIDARARPRSRRSCSASAPSSRRRTAPRPAPPSRPSTRPGPRASSAPWTRWEAELPPLTRFVLPGGTRTAAALHVARTVCRRAERRAVALAAEVEVEPAVLAYLNRLSDFLFVAARLANRRARRDEPQWDPSRGSGG